ncbi:MAG: hypothetical protein R3B07_32130 [Polyangiaceae bacterium]
MMSHSELVEQLNRATAEATRQEQRDLAEIKEREREVRESASTLRRQLESDYKSELRRRQDAACAELNGGLVRILSAFHTEPSRALTVQLIEFWGDQRVKILEATAYDIADSRRIALALAEVMRQRQPNDVGRFAQPWPGTTDWAESQVRHGLETRDPAATHSALLALETAVLGVNVGATQGANSEIVWAAKFSDLLGSQPRELAGGA